MTGGPIETEAAGEVLLPDVLDRDRGPMVERSGERVHGQGDRATTDGLEVDGAVGDGGGSTDLSECEDLDCSP